MGHKIFRNFVCRARRTWWEARQHIRDGEHLTVLPSKKQVRSCRRGVGSRTPHPNFVGQQRRVYMLLEVHSVNVVVLQPRQESTQVRHNLALPNRWWERRKIADVRGDYVEHGGPETWPDLRHIYE